MSELTVPGIPLVSNFEGLLEAVRALRPKCPDCGRPMDRESDGVRQRKNDAGQLQRVCRPCFQGEIAEMQLAHPLR